jgi:hypothetical protein
MKQLNFITTVCSPFASLSIHYITSMLETLSLNDLEIITYESKITEALPELKQERRFA